MALLMAAESALRLQDWRAALDFAAEARRPAQVDSIARGTWSGAADLMSAKAHLIAGDTVAARAALADAVAGLQSGAGTDHPLTREAQGVLSRVAP